MHSANEDKRNFMMGISSAVAARLRDARVPTYSVDLLWMYAIVRSVFSCLV